MTSKVERKLVAIVFTDIAGYTSQMSKNQDLALSLLDTKRITLKPLIKKHHGTLVKEMGDGTLSYFTSSIDATNCSLALQKSLYNNNDLNIRIGIHLGDTSFRENDIFGDGVNIASRLEQMSPPGGVLVSKNVFDELNSRKGYIGISVGLQSMKGVGRLIEVFALKEKYLNIPKPSDFEDTKIEIHSDKQIPSVAIIPFDNKGKKEDVFYSYGISADIISDCSSADFIRVVGIKDIENLSYNKLNYEDISKELFVRYIAQGTLWKIDDMFQLTIELYDSKHSTVIWSDRWQEKWENLSEIKRKLSDALLKTLNAKSNITNESEVYDTKAYEYYLRAKYMYERRGSMEDTEISRGLLKKAFNIDNNLTEARLLLGWTYYEIGEYETSMKIYKDCLNSISDNKIKKGDILHNIGTIYSQIGEYDQCLKYFKESIEIKVKSNHQQGIANSYNSYGALYLRKGNYNKALKSFKNSFKIFDKLNHDFGICQTLNNIGIIYSIKGDYINSIKYQKKSLNKSKEMGDHKGISTCLTNIGLNYYLLGDYDEANKNYYQALDITRSLKLQVATSNLLNNIGLIFRNLEEYRKSIDHHKKAFNINSEIGDKVAIVNTQNNLGIACALMGKYKESSKYLLESLSMQNKMEIKNNSIFLEAKVYLYFTNKFLNKSYNFKEVKAIIKSIPTISFDLSYRIYQVSGDNSYLEKSYSQIKEKSNIMTRVLKNRFLNYPMPKEIVEEYKNVFK